MDVEELRKLDEHADGVIRNWSFAALLANVAPPPFDLMAVGTTFAGMGSHLARIYGVKVEPTKLKEIGLALATGVGGVLAAGYVATGLLKYIPGVNVWVALLLQPPLVGAVAFSAGHAFKQHYHAILLGDHALTPTDVSEIAVAALRNRLNLLGVSMPSRIGGREAEKLSPAELIQKGTYEERKAIVVVENTKEKRFITNELVKRKSPVVPLCVRSDEISTVPFHDGPLRRHLVYIGHPHVPGRYFPAARFHVKVFEDKTLELIRIIRSLGATYFRVEHLSGFMKEIDVQGDLGFPIQTVAKAEIKGEAKVHRKESHTIIWEEHLEPCGEPGLPEDLIWYEREPVWQGIVVSRLNSKQNEINIQICYEEDFGITASVASSLSAIKTKLFRLDLGGAYVDYQETKWNVRVAFA